MDFLVFMDDARVAAFLAAVIDFMDFMAFGMMKDLAKETCSSFKMCLVSITKCSKMCVRVYRLIMNEADERTYIIHTYIIYTYI